MTALAVLLDSGFRRNDDYKGIYLQSAENELPRGKPRGINRKNPIERRSKLRGIKPPNGGLNVQFPDIQGVFLNKVTSGFDFITHEGG
jgi:hypothetical protein